MGGSDETPKKPQVSFKTRVLNEVISNAEVYYSHFVCVDYLVFSPAFHNHSYYEISAHKGNYLHLTGVSTALSADEFFDKCLNGTLTEDDFTLGGSSRNEKTAKGAIRDKIRSLPFMPSVIGPGSLVEEDFKKNRVSCSFASSDGLITMGFIALSQALPMTLLRGNELDHHKAQPVRVVLSKKSDEVLYSSILCGAISDLIPYFGEIKHLLNDDLKNRVAAFLPKDEAERNKNADPANANVAQSIQNPGES